MFGSGDGLGKTFPDATSLYDEVDRRAQQADETDNNSYRRRRLCDAKGRVAISDEELDDRFLNKLLHVKAAQRMSVEDALADVIFRSVEVEDCRTRLMTEACILSYPSPISLSRAFVFADAERCETPSR